MIKKLFSSFLLTGLALLSSLSANAADPRLRVELDCRNSPGSINLTKVTPAMSVKTYGKMSYLEGKLPVTKKWQKYTIEFMPIGNGSVVLGLSAASNKDKTRWLDIDDIKVENAEVRNPSFEDLAVETEAASWRYYTQSSFIRNAADAYHGKNYLRLNSNYPARQSVAVKSDMPVKITFMVRDGGNMPLPTDKNFKSTSYSAGTPKKVAAPDGCGVRVNVDGFNSEVVIKNVTSSSNMNCGYVGWHGGAYGKNTVSEYMSKKPVTDKWQRYEISFIPSRHGEVTLHLRGTSSGSGKNYKWVAFDNFKAEGVQELRNPSFETVLGGYADGWVAYPWNFRFNKNDASHGKNYLVATNNESIRQIVNVTAGKRVTISFDAKMGGIAPHPERKTAPKTTDHPKDYYALYDTTPNVRVKYLPLSDKGFKGSDVVERLPGAVVPNTPAPQAKFVTPAAKTAAKTDYIKVPFELLEESGIARDARIRFGFPMVKGQFFNLNNIRVLDPAGKEVPAQFSVLTFWPDKSIKSALVQFTAPLKANEKCNCFIEAGKSVTPAKPSAGKLAYTDKGSVITVDTGVMKSVIDKKNFNFLKSVTVNGKYVGKFSDAGIVLTAENGEKLTPAASPVKITLEEKGPYRLTFRVDGLFRSTKGVLFNCVSRMSFYAGSAEVNFEVLFINTYLETEFNDFKSIVMSYIPADKPSALKMDNFTSNRIFQHHDKKLQVGDKFNTKRLSGSGSVKAGDSTLTFNLFKAALRYPKAFSIDGNAVNFELLPVQPDKNFGSDLKFYHRFPFCEGFYRMKWGMSFRENITVDFAGKTPAAALSAEEVIAIVDRDYIASTAVYQGVQPKKIDNFDSWDAAAVDGFRRHMKLKEKQREYGFLNYGDWFGERGRNWTNNEYDMPHGLFMLALRTGNRDAFRWAKIAAQHQADVDIIKAYPDKFFVGANPQHSIGHTGISYQRGNMATWTLLYDGATAGTNGHTWSAGMCEAWMLCGDAATMDSALLLGNHLANYVAPYFTRLTTHERSAGWSNTALVHLYRATSDPRYMAASKRLVSLIMGEQKFHLGGAWPHRLPSDHGANKRGTFGNCPYLVGILLETLRQHYLINPDPRVKKSIIAAANWQHRSFRPDYMGWGYGVSWDNKPYNSVGFGLNMLCGPGVATGARLSKDEKLFTTAKLSAAMVMFSGFSAVGKSLAIQLCMMPSYIDELSAFAAENPAAEPYRYSDSLIADTLSTAPLPPEDFDVTTNEFRVRGALNKEFSVTLKSDADTITVHRNRCGAYYGGEKEYSAKVVAPDGKVIKEFSGSAFEKVKKVEIPVSGKSGDDFRILIRDDYKGHWHVVAGKADVFSIILPGYSYSNAPASTFNIHIPEGVDEVPLQFTCTHGGIFRLAVMDKNGKVETISAGCNVSRSNPWDTPGLAAIQTIKIKPAADGSRVRRIIILAAGDVMLNTKVPGVKLSLVK